MSTAFTVSVRENGKRWRAICKFKDGETWRQKTKTLPADVTGKKQATAAAEAWARTFIVEQERQEIKAEQPLATPPRALTVPQYVEDYITSKANARSITPTVVNDYYLMLNSRIRPYFKDVLLEDLTPAMVQEWLNTLHKELAAVTITKIFRLLKAALERATNQELISKNPARRGAVEAPSYKQEPVNALTDGSVKAIALYLEGNATEPFNLAVCIALLSGLRRSEICALQWRDIDLEGRTARIRHSLGRVTPRLMETLNLPERQRIRNSNVYYLKEPKTAQGRRTVALPPEVCDVLELRRAQMAQACMMAGIRFDESLFVTGEIDGSILAPCVVTNRWRKLAAALQLRGVERDNVVFHDLRHTYATRAIAQGVDVKTVANQLGHSNAAMTLNVYTAVSMENAHKAARAVADSINATKQRGAVLRFMPTGTEGR